jgi:MoaA/NifB/PqqE/SkfB family radical SAM enzyme
MKNRVRENYSFANINLLGKCNADCFFCLGKDLPEYFNKQNQLGIHFSKWNNFQSFIAKNNQLGIKKIFITGQNTDSLRYEYLKELIMYLQGKGFEVGLRTNGYLAEQKRDCIESCNGEIGYTLNSLICKSNEFIMGRRDLIDPNTVFNIGKNVRVSIPINRFNIGEFERMVESISGIENIRYIQARRISTDTRGKELSLDIKLYELIYEEIASKYKRLEDFYLAQRFEMFGKEVCFWRTTETSVNSINYFTDGTLSEEYFIVEGYLKSRTEPKGE